MTVAHPDPSQPPLRLFLDSGVIIAGCLDVGGSCKAVLMLAVAQERTLTVVLAEAVERETHRAIDLKVASLDPPAARFIRDGFAGWLSRVRLERYPYPSEAALRAAAPTIMPVLRHANDLPAVVTAIQARPDWVLSTNTRHWNPQVAQRTGLRIATPLAFLQTLAPKETGSDATK